MIQDQQIPKDEAGRCEVEVSCPKTMDPGELGMGQNLTTRNPQVLVFGFIYQDSLNGHLVLTRSQILAKAVQVSGFNPLWRHSLLCA